MIVAGFISPRRRICSATPRRSPLRCRSACPRSGPSSPRRAVGLFSIVVDLGTFGASLFALGYGAHETAPQRVLPFYAAFLAGMTLVVFADDAFTFLLCSEFMSLTSSALVMSPHRVPENVYAGYVYLIMASFGTLALLLCLASSPALADLTVSTRCAAHPSRRSAFRFDPGADRRRIEGRHRAAARLAAAGAPGGAKPRLGAEIGVMTRVPSTASCASCSSFAARIGLVVEHRRAGGGWRRRRDGRAIPPDPGRDLTTSCSPIIPSKISASSSSALGWRSRFQTYGLPFFAAALAFTAALFHVFNNSLFKSLLSLARGRDAHGDRRTRHGAAAERPHPPHAADRVRLPGRLRGDLGAAAAEMALPPSG